MFKPGDEIIPGFKLEAFLGRGEFGQVWRAASPGGTHLALKFIDLGAQQGKKEFRAVQRIKGIRHPHLVPTYAMWLLDDSMKVIEDAEFGAPDDALSDLRGTLIPSAVGKATSPDARMLVIASALCDQNLAQRLDECRGQSLPGIPTEELLGYMADAAKAIDFLNEPRHKSDQGLFAVHHCDIKPANIMIVGGSAVVGDLGVARVLAKSSDAARATSVYGSVAYAAPEILDNRSETTTDQYSLAITYYELRTGQLPLTADSVAQAVRDKTEGRISFDLVPKTERLVLRRATAVIPSQRFPTTTDFIDHLSKALDTTGSDGSLKSLATLAAGVLFVVGMLTLALNRERIWKPKEVVVRPADGDKMPGGVPASPDVIDDTGGGPTPDESSDALPEQGVQADEMPLDVSRDLADAAAEERMEQASKLDASDQSADGAAAEPVVTSKAAEEKVADETSVDVVTDAVEEMSETQKAAASDSEQPDARDDLFDAAVEQLSAALSRGEPLPPLKSLGSDSETWTWESIPTGFSPSPDGQAYVKAFGRKLYLQSLARADDRGWVDIANLSADIGPTAWLDHGCCFADAQGLAWQVPMDTSMFHHMETLEAKQLLPSGECAWIEVPNKSGILVAARDASDGPRSSSDDGHRFAVYLHEGQDSMQPLDALSPLMATSWPVMIESDWAGSRILVAQRLIADAQTYLLRDRTNQQSYDLSESEANELAWIGQATFLEDGHSLLLLGKRATEDGNSVYWISHDGDHLSVRRLVSEFGQPVALTPDGHTGFVVLRANAVTHCIRYDDHWVERAITVCPLPDDLDQSIVELSYRAVSGLVIAPRRWLLLVTEKSSLIAAKLRDADSIEAGTDAVDCFELPWEPPERTVTRLDVVGNRLLATTEAGATTWYDLDELVLVAESLRHSQQ